MAFVAYRRFFMYIIVCLFCVSDFVPLHISVSGGRGEGRSVDAVVPRGRQVVGGALHPASRVPGTVPDVSSGEGAVVLKWSRFLGLSLVIAIVMT